MGDMVTARDCCLKTIRFWSVCAETPCPCTSVNAVVEEDQVLPIYWSGIPCDSRMEVAARVDDVTHGTVYTARIFNDADGLKSYEYTVDNEDGEGPDLYVWQVAEALAALINAASDDFDTPITATAYRTGFVRLNAGEVPIRADFLKVPVGEGATTMTDHATRWPTPAVSGPCVILNGTGSYDEETSGGLSRVSNFAGFSCWDSIAALPPCVDNQFKSAIAGKAVLVVDSKVYVWRAKVSRLTAGTNYAILRTTQIGVYSPSHDDVTYAATAADEEGTHNELAANIASAVNAAWGGDGFVATAPGGGWVEIHHSTGHRRFGNDSTRYCKIVHDGYTDDTDLVGSPEGHGLDMTGWDLIPVTGQQNARLMDAGLGEEVFDYDIITGTDEAKAADYASSFNTWVSATPAFKGFRDVTATRVYWGQQHAGTVPTASGSATALYLDSGASASDDYYNSCRVVIDSGTGAGQIQTITDYVGAGKLANVSPGWATNPATDSVFRIYRHVGVQFSSTNPAHPADLEGDQPDKGTHDGAHDDIFWARNGNLTSADDQTTNAWTGAGIVRKCCGPLHGSAYAVRFVGTDPVTPFTAYDVTASITVDNENTTGDCKGDGPDDTPAEIAAKWVTEFNAVASGIPANVRPTATHVGNGVIVLEGATYGSDPTLAGAFNFAVAQPDSAWLGFSVIQQPVSGEAETDTVWYYDGLLTEIPYRPFVGWPYLGSTTEWHAANIATANIIGAEYAVDGMGDPLDCTDEPPPAAGCPGWCDECVGLDNSVTITGTVTFAPGVTMDIDIGPVSFAGCTPSSFSTLWGVDIGYPACGVGVQYSLQWTKLCPTSGHFAVVRTEVAAGGAPPCNTNLVRQDFSWINPDGDAGVLNPGSGEWEPGGTATFSGAITFFKGASQWHLGDDPGCDETYEKCLPGPAPEDEGGGMPEPPAPALGASTPPAKKTPAGVAGTVLTAMLRKLGYRAKPGCDCHDHARMMNSMGTDWCEAHIDFIVGVLKEQAGKLKKPFIETAARLLVKRAIATARKREAHRLQTRKEA